MVVVVISYHPPHFPPPHTNIFTSGHTPTQPLVVLARSVSFKTFAHTRDQKGQVQHRFGTNYWTSILKPPYTFLPVHGHSDRPHPKASDHSHSAWYSWNALLPKPPPTHTEQRERERASWWEPITVPTALYDYMGKLFVK